MVGHGDGADDDDEEEEGDEEVTIYATKHWSLTHGSRAWTNRSRRACVYQWFCVSCVHVTVYLVVVLMDGCDFSTKIMACICAMLF